MKNVTRGCEVPTINVDRITHGLKRIEADANRHSRHECRNERCQPDRYLEGSEEDIDILGEKAAVLEKAKKAYVTKKGNDQRNTFS